MSHDHVTGTEEMWIPGDDVCERRRSHRVVASRHGIQLIADGCDDARYRRAKVTPACSTPLTVFAATRHHDVCQ